MNNLLRFFSLAALTQLTLVVNQLAILPAQLRTWGSEATAGWYSMTAVAMLASVADFGLRSAGHVPLIHCHKDPSDLEAQRSFLEVWSWARVLVTAVAAVLMIGDFGSWSAFHSDPYPVWRALLIVSTVTETLLIVRITYMDTLGFYDRAELGYFLFSFTKAGLLLVGLLFLGWRETSAATVHVVTVLMAMAIQSWLARDVKPIALMAPLRLGPVQAVLPIASQAMSEPLSNWARLSLPVVTLSTIAPAAAVNTYVALRALFGVVRASIQQAARPAAYAMLRATEEGQEPATGRRVLSGVLLVGSLFGSMFSFVLAADNQRLVGLWLGKLDHLGFVNIALPFAVGTPFYIYLLLYSLRIRTNDLRAAAHRQYAYLSLALACSGLAVVTGAWMVYLWLMLGCEIILSFIMATQLNTRLRAAVVGPSRRGFCTAAVCAASILTFWQLVAADPWKMFSGRSVSAAGTSSLTTLMYLSATLLGVAAINRDTVRTLINYGMARFKGRADEAVPPAALDSADADG